MMLHVGDAIPNFEPAQLSPEGWYVMQRIGAVVYEARLEAQPGGFVRVVETRVRSDSGALPPDVAKLQPSPYSDMKASK